MASLDSLTFNTDGYHFQGTQGQQKIWFYPQGGGISLSFFPLKPNLPLVKTVKDLEAAYRGMMPSPMQVVECRVVSLDGIPSVYLLAKTRDQKSGAAIYLGSVTIPFRECSYVVKSQCMEEGPTGLREAILIDEAMAKGTGRIEGDRFVPDGWNFDDHKFDGRFPDHPLSRTRRELERVITSARLSSEAKAKPRFDLPKAV